MTLTDLTSSAPVHDHFSHIVTTLLKEILDHAFPNHENLGDASPRYKFQGHLLSSLNQQIGYTTEADEMRKSDILITFLALFYKYQKANPKVEDYTHLKTALRDLEAKYKLKFSENLFNYTSQPILKSS